MAQGLNETQRALLFEQKASGGEDERSELNVELILKNDIGSIVSEEKKMAVFVVPKEQLGGEFYLELIQRAIDMGVSTAIRNRTSGATNQDSGDVYLFFFRDHEAWRIPAYLSMKKAFFDQPWSDGLEILQRIFLGYSESEARSWLNEHRRTRMSWLGLTCYFVINDAQRGAIERLASRCIDPASLTKEIEVFYNTNNTPLKESAHELIPQGMNLCRATVKFDFFKKLFERDLSVGRKIAFFVSIINSSSVDDLNKSLQTNFQFFDDYAPRA